MNMSLPIELDEILPHKPPMRLIKRLLSFEHGKGTAEAIIDDDNIFLDDAGYLNTTTLIELIAQTFAAIKCYDDLLCRRPLKRGFLVGIRKVQFMGKAIIGDILKINVKTRTTLGAFMAAYGEVIIRDEVIAKGEITVWIDQDS
ncbi:MAG: hypothetical protein HQK79_07495 [Desulfobacterales bacterium]|nr:hypothetical protein [Desulfobacterales bacterium]